MKGVICLKNFCHLLSGSEIKNFCAKVLKIKIQTFVQKFLKHMMAFISKLLAALLDVQNLIPEIKQLFEVCLMVQKSGKAFA